MTVPYTFDSEIGCIFVSFGVRGGACAASRISRRERRRKTKTAAGEKLAFHPAPVLFSVADTAQKSILTASRAHSPPNPTKPVRGTGVKGTFVPLSGVRGLKAPAVPYAASVHCWKQSLPFPTPDDGFRFRKTNIRIVFPASKWGKPNRNEKGRLGKKQDANTKGREETTLFLRGLYFQ